MNPKYNIGDVVKFKGDGDIGLVVGHQAIEVNKEPRMMYCVCYATYIEEDGDYHADVGYFGEGVIAIYESEKEI